MVSVEGDSTDGTSTVLDGEILLIDAATIPATVTRHVHHRSDGDDYFSDPFVSLSPSGSRIVFASDWGRSGMTDTYLITLPTVK